MQQGHIIKNSIIPVTFAALTVKFYTLQLLSAPLFPCAFSSAVSNSLVKTDISIAQKTCVFRPVDISVAAAKPSKLIYQSVYSLLGIPLPSAHCVRSHLPQGDGFWRWRKSFRHSAKASPWGSWQARQGLPEGVTLPQIHKKAAAPGMVQRLVYNIKVSQFFFAA